jgi:hypothetical protein
MYDGRASRRGDKNKNMSDQNPKKGMSTLAIVLIVVGVLLVLLVGTCGIAGYFVGRTVSEVKQNIADGGIVLVAPPEVRAELEADAGAKKDFVGSWTSKSGKSTLDIDADGNLKLVKDEGGTKQTLAAPIADFKDNNIRVRLGLDFVLVVSEPPHRVNGGVGDHWEMTADRITWERKE